MKAKSLLSFLANWLLVSSLWLLSSSPVFAQAPAQLPELENIFGRVLSVVIIIGGFLSFIALIVAGFRYITARGDPKIIADAQSKITYAILGLAFVILAWLILQFIANFTGVTSILFFKIQGF